MRTDECKKLYPYPRIFEVPISYSGRSYQEGKKINWRDGVRALSAIVKFGLLNATHQREADSRVGLTPPEPVSETTLPQ